MKFKDKAEELENNVLESLKPYEKSFKNSC